MIQSCKSCSVDVRLCGSFVYLVAFPLLIVSVIVSLVHFCTFMLKDSLSPPPYIRILSVLHLPKEGQNIL